MADYIDREELLKKAYVFDTQSNMQWVSMKDIKSMPSVDAVEVVRCKDCKHRYKSSVYEHERCDRLIIPVLDDDFFCKWGEKE